MLQLESNCRAGKFAVFPPNWKTAKANKNIHWRISYWFYDDNINQKKKVVIKGMNYYDQLKDKQDAVKTIIEDELNDLKEKGYNPFTKSYTAKNDNEISEYTPFIESLNYAYNNLHAEVETKRDIKSCLKQITAAIKALNYDRLTISQVRRKHIRLIFDTCEKLKSYWSNNLFNHYRKYLSILFKQLVNFDVIDVNPIREIEKRSSLKRIRQTLTKEERSKVNDFLHDNYYTFWRFVQMFYASGAREIELMNVKVKDVDLIKQTFKVVIKKGRVMSEVTKVITNDILYLWQELIGDSPADYFIFSKFLKPGIKSISRYQLTKRWKVHVKKKLGITGDLYSLKHSSLDEITRQLSINEAARLASHTNIQTTMMYAVGEKDRLNERLKLLKNKFA